MAEPSRSGFCFLATVNLAPNDSPRRLLLGDSA